MNDELGKLILNELKSLNNRFDKLEDKVENVTEEVANLNQKFTNLNQKFTNLNQEVTNLKQELAVIKRSVILIENDHGKKIGALFDGYQLLSEKIDRMMPLVEKIPQMQDDISIIKSVVTRHAGIFNAMRAAM